MTWEPRPLGDGEWEIVETGTGEVRRVPVSRVRHAARVALRNAVSNAPWPSGSPDAVVYDAEVLDQLRDALRAATRADITRAKP